MNRKTKKARADAHRSSVRADSCLSGFWSMPCDSIPAALPQRPGPRLDCRRTVPPNLPWGKNPVRRGARGIPGDGENFKRPGGGVQGGPQARAWASARPSVRRFPPRSAPPKRPVFAHFRRSLAGVATVAQALEVACVGERSPVTLVVPDVVHVRGPRPDAVLSTLTAPRLPQKLLTAQRLQVLRPVHPAPGLRLLAPLLGLRLVLCAVPARHQPIAARV